jgi:hypothetical protein
VAPGLLLSRTHEDDRPMTRSVDFGFQLDPDGPRMFGFWHRVDGFHHLPGFIVANLNEAWDSWESFARDHAADFEDGLPHPLAPVAEDLKGLCPPWVSE